MTLDFETILFYLDDETSRCLLRNASIWKRANALAFASTHVNYQLRFAHVCTSRMMDLYLSNTPPQSLNKLQFHSQTFFKDHMGVDLYMEPNFEDYSCQVNIVSDFVQCFLLLIVMLKELCTCHLYMLTFVKYAAKIQNKAQHLTTTKFTLFLLQFNFGVPPPPLDTDKALKEPCLDICTNARRRRELGRNSSSDALSCPQV